MTAAVATAAELRARLGAAADARARLATRPLRETIAALAAAAARWRADVDLAAALPAVAALAPPMIAAALPLAAEALEAGAVSALVEREWGADALDAPAPARPALVAHVLASNVPALALPAIALSCLAGAAVLVKSGRADPLSAPAFARALAAVDPALAATVVTAYWSGGDLACEEAGLAGAAVVVATGGEPALAALARRLGPRLVAHGPRLSLVALGRAALEDADALARAIALDVVLHDQRGCLSPHAVYVEEGGPLGPRDLAERLAAALATIGRELPPGPAGTAERASARLAAAEAEWEPGAAVLGGADGRVIYAPTAALRPAPARRCVRVHPIRDLAALPALLPSAQVECVGLAGADPAPLVPGLRARGVSRLCRPGRMQRPPLSWPRGQASPLGVLRGAPGLHRLEVEP